MNGFKYLICVLPLLLHNLHVVSSEEKDNDHHDEPSINMVKLKSENENMTPGALDVIINWWKSIPLDFLKLHTKYEKPEDYSKIDQILLESLTPDGFSRLRGWWSGCPPFNMMNSTLFTKEGYQPIMNGDVKDNLNSADSSTLSSLPNQEEQKVTKEDIDHILNGGINPKPKLAASSSINYHDYSGYATDPYSRYDADPYSEYNSYSYNKPKRRRMVHTREYGYTYGGY